MNGSRLVRLWHKLYESVWSSLRGRWTLNCRTDVHCPAPSVTTVFPSGQIVRDLFCSISSCCFVAPITCAFQLPPSVNMMPISVICTWSSREVLKHENRQLETVYYSISKFLWFPWHFGKHIWDFSSAPKGKLLPPQSVWTPSFWLSVVSGNSFLLSVLVNKSRVWFLSFQYSILILKL